MISNFAARAAFSVAAALFTLPVLADEPKTAPSAPQAATSRDERPAFIGKETYELTACTADHHIFKLRFRPYARMYEIEKFRATDGEVYLPIDSFIEGFEAVATTAIGRLTYADFQNKESATLDAFNTMMISYFDAFERDNKIAILIQPKGRKYWGISDQKDDSCKAGIGYQQQSWSI